MISYLGPKGSYSHIAALSITDDRNLTAKADFEEVLKYVFEDKSFKAVIPIENSIEGSVNNCLDLLTELELWIEKEIVLNIEHCLICKEGVKLSSVKKILSHSQAYNQCKKNIKSILPDAEVIFTSSTSEAVHMLDETSAAIAGAQNIKSGLICRKTDMQDVQNNCTRFLVVSADKALNQDARKTSIIFEAPNKPGGLLNLLDILYNHNLNMTKIESRPHKSALGRYIFFVDFAGNVLDENTQHALRKIKDSTVFYKLLGSY